MAGLLVLALAGCSGPAGARPTASAAALAGCDYALAVAKGEIELPKK